MSRIAAYRSELHHFTTSLRNASSIELSEDSFLDEPIQAELAAALDASALNANELYLGSLASDRASAAAEEKALRARENAADREIAAKRLPVNDDVIQRINEIYAAPIVPESIRLSHTLATNGEYSEYLSFANKLLELRVEGIEKMDKRLVTLLLQQYVTSHYEDDDDFIADEAVVDPMCPLSKQPLEEPVRAPCGHFYSKAAIENVLSTSSGPQRSHANGAVSCSNAGCSGHIVSNKLVRDPFLDIRVNEWKHNKEIERLRRDEGLNAL